MDELRQIVLAHGKWYVRKEKPRVLAVELDYWRSLIDDERVKYARSGDYLVLTEDGEVVIMAKEIFEAQYEPDYEEGWYGWI